MSYGPVGPQIYAQTLYPYSDRQVQVAKVIVAKRDPTVRDKYDIGYLFLNKVNKNLYCLSQYVSGVPQWVLISNGTYPFIYGDVVTTDDTTTTLLSITLEDGQAITVEAQVAGVLPGTAQMVGGVLTAAFVNHSGTVTALQNPDFTGDQNIDGGSVTVSTDGDGNDALIQVTGLAATTIDWSIQATFITVS